MGRKTITQAMRPPQNIPKKYPNNIAKIDPKTKKKESEKNMTVFKIINQQASNSLSRSI